MNKLMETVFKSKLQHISYTSLALDLNYQTIDSYKIQSRTFQSIENTQVLNIEGLSRT